MLKLEPRATGAHGVAARFQGTVAWAPDAPPTLTDVDVTARNGELVIIVGATGSGKTSLLSALLGLTDEAPGAHALLRGSVAYVSQVPYLFGGARRSSPSGKAPRRCAVPAAPAACHGAPQQLLRAALSRPLSAHDLDGQGPAQSSSNSALSRFQRKQWRRPCVGWLTHSVQQLRPVLPSQL